MFVPPFQTWWDESDTSRRLGARLWDVTRCRDSLESCAVEVDQEMEALTLVTSMLLSAETAAASRGSASVNGTWFCEGPH